MIQLKEMWLTLTVFCTCVYYGSAGVNILKPGPCPTLAAHPELDWSEISGEWKVVELPKSVSCPCNGNIQIFVDKIQENSKDQHAFPNRTQRSLSPSWTRLTVSAPVCRNPEKNGRSLHWDLEILPNPARAGIAVVRPSYPWDLFGFGSMTVISTDYTNYAVVHFCNGLLLEHISLPLVLVRDTVSLDLSSITRIHFSLELQGISTWDMENVNDVSCESKRETTEPTSLTSVFVDANTDLLDTLTSYYSTVNQTLLQTLATPLLPLDPTITKSSDDQMEFPTELSPDYNPKDDAEWLDSEFYTFKTGFDDTPAVFPIGSEIDIEMAEARRNMPPLTDPIGLWKPILMPIPPGPEDGKIAHLIGPIEEQKEVVE